MARCEKLKVAHSLSPFTHLSPFRMSHTEKCFVQQSLIFYLLLKSIVSNRLQVFSKQAFQLLKLLKRRKPGESVSFVRFFPSLSLCESSCESPWLIKFINNGMCCRIFRCQCTSSSPVSSIAWYDSVVTDCCS